MLYKMIKNACCLCSYRSKPISVKYLGFSIEGFGKVDSAG